MINKTALSSDYKDKKSCRKIRLIILQKSETVSDYSSVLSFLEGAEMECKKRGIALSVYNLNHCSNRCKKQLKIILEDLSTPTLLYGINFPVEVIHAFHSVYTPVVYFGYQSTGAAIDEVVVDNKHLVKSAINYLIQNGHSRIGFIRDKYNASVIEEKLDEFVSEMIKRKIPVMYENIIELYDDGKGDRPNYGIDRKATAFLADNDIVALKAIKLFRQTGYRIPEDISVLGSGNISFSGISSPGLTTFRIPKKEIGSTAVMRLCEMTELTGNEKIKISVQAELVKRNSVKDINCVKQLTT